MCMFTSTEINKQTPYPNLHMRNTLVIYSFNKYPMLCHSNNDNKKKDHKDKIILSTFIGISNGKRAINKI